ncbi:MAG: bifunctional oligoribonuclease/PAP phosphatase NrnA [Tissierellia bacterium]|nr:bifunctional oligoribonuclease/PAP phosphatase NrnA [Tissierellia bacterium]
MDKKIDFLMDDAIRLIKESDNILIASHVQPDGDSIGSILALGMAIEKLKGKVRILKVDDIPSDYQFLPNIELIKEFDDENIDLFIALDCGDMERLGSGKKLALKAKQIVNIDHHITNDNFGDLNIVSPSSAATGELVYKIIKKMDVQIDKNIATCLYTAISTDTGSFMYSNTTYKTHLIVAELLKIGININDININIYQSRSMERTKLFLDSLDTLEILLDDKVAIVTTTQDMLESNDAKLEDTEGIISFVRDIDTVEVACLLKEIDESEVKVSIRSKKAIDVSKICNKFNGGGHIRAAGCTIYGSIKEAKKLILKEIEMAFR